VLAFWALYWAVHPAETCAAQEAQESTCQVPIF